MPARLNPRHSEMVRQKIQAANLIFRLHECVEGRVELTQVQLGAAIALLDRSVPKLSTIQHVGDPENPVQMAIRWAQEKSKS